MLNNKSNSIELSPYHKIFYNEWKLNPNSSQYNIVFDQDIADSLNVFQLKNAIERFISQHVLLNSHIKVIEGEPYFIQNEQIRQLEIYDCISNESLYNYISQPFNLEDEALYRFAVFTMADGSYRFILVWHHLVMDGASVNIAITEISNYYNSTSYNTKYSLYQQKDIVETTTELFNKRLAAYRSLYQDFWDNLLVDIEPLDLRFLKPHVTYNKDDIPCIREIRFSFNRAETRLLIKTSRKYLITPYVYGQCVFAILLYRYTSQDKFAISYPLSIKGGVDFLCGAKINTNLKVYNFTQTTTIIDLFNQTREFIKSLKQNSTNCSYYPIDGIVEHVNKDLLKVGFADTDLKDTKFNFIGAETLKINHEFNIDIAAKLFFEQQTKDGQLNYRVKYNPLEIDCKILENFVNHYKILFFEILNDLANDVQNKLILQYQLLSDNEYKQIVYDFNKTEQPYPNNKTIHQLFEEQVSKTPDSIALVYENTQLTYIQLNSMANQLANYLRGVYLIKGDDLIALCLDRSEYIIISILGVLKAGGAYVPIDTSCPTDRIKYILQDTQSKILITNDVYISKLSIFENITKICIDNEVLQKLLLSESIANLNTCIAITNLAYVIYTSGTTGNPKGVMLEHRNVINTIWAIKNIYNSNEVTKIAAFCNYTFDVSVSEFLVSLFHGHELHLLSNEVRQDVELIGKYINSRSINYIYLPPVLLSYLPHADYSSLKGIIYAGEPCDSSVASYWCDKVRLYNYYGPTEAAIYATGLQVKKDKAHLIGKPLNNVKAYVLNKHLQILPIGALGQLYLSGDGLARGYLNQPDLTQAKFIKLPFCSLKASTPQIYEKLYATGDLVRQFSDGDIEFIERIDSQVKIRGYRIELDEIANKISCYPQIKQAIVLIKNTSELKDNITTNSCNQYVVGYYVSEHRLDEVDIINYLSTQLLSYMIPSLLVHIDKLPITLQGKLNYKELPVPDFSPNCDLVASHNDLELTICKIYAEILKLPLEKIGVNHDFFKLGGNSILAIRLVTKLQNYFKITVNDVFKLRTPSKLAKDVILIKDSLRYKLENIKELYRQLANNNLAEEIKANKYQLDYMQQLKKLQFTPRIKAIKNILLTGATGYLGCNILYQLLSTTQYKIYLLVRANSNVHAYSRLSNTFKFYFDLDLDIYRERVVVMSSDLINNNLNLDIETYQHLVQNVDSIIHAAASIKHYGNYETFYQSNIQSTINLLELAKLTKVKDFHYISTISVFMDGYVAGEKYYIFNEDSNNEILQNKTNFYVQTKYTGELVTIEYRQYGVNGNIYRVGNLCINSLNYKTPQNIEENSFFIRIKTILNLGIMPKELSLVEISPVDWTALAIIKLFNQAELTNQTYHVFNPNTCNLLKLLAKNKNINIITVPFDEFIDIILSQLENNTDSEQIELFMLHQLWLQDIDITHYSTNIILQNKTEAILSKLDFKWQHITSNTLSELINKSFERRNEMLERKQIDKHVEYMADKMPCALYWLNLDYMVTGVNKKLLKAIGAASRDDIIGKTVYDFYPTHVADSLHRDFKIVAETGQDLEHEHMIVDITTGKSRYFAATVSPLRDSYEKIIGIIGTSIEITAEKEAESLKYQNDRLEFYKKNYIIEQQQQDEFRKIVNQVVHDIKSPVSTLRMILPYCDVLPEEIRITIKQSAGRIQDIAGNLLNRFKPYLNEEAATENKLSPTLISVDILEIVAEKKYEYAKLSVDFVVEISKQSYFVFINTNVREFKRMMSNLINNAVDALDGKSGVITVQLDIVDNKVEIIIKDNGKGMPDSVKEKILNNIAVTSNKKDGHGIGFEQIRDTLAANEGKLAIKSKVGAGTIIILSFPVSDTPDWICNKIELKTDDFIVILDDDPSIHGAWRARLKKHAIKIKCKHFEIGNDAIEFINNLSEVQKDKVILLTDYELLKQGLHGLDVINNTNIKRSILVTSHHNDDSIHVLAGLSNTKILPKLLASEVVINHLNSSDTVKTKKVDNKNLKKVDLVIIDDDDLLVDTLVRCVLQGKKVDTYYSALEFLGYISIYSKNTKFLIDNQFKGESITGIEIATTLYELGFHQLYLFSGWDFTNDNSIPHFLNIIAKTDTDTVKQLVGVNTNYNNT